MRRLARSIGAKLFVWIFVSMVVVFLSVSYFIALRTSQAWTASFQEHATQTSAVIERALRYAMLQNRKDAVHAALTNMAREPGIKSIRIYDKKGRIAFSTDARELKRRVDENAEACTVCHEPNQWQRPTQRLSQSRTFRDSSGALLLGHIQPIENAPECSRAPCHAHPAEKTVLGVLDLRMSIAVVDEARQRARTTTLWGALMMAVVGGLATAIFIWRFLRKPVQHLVEGTRRVAAGRLDTHIRIEQNGELGELARALNSMTDELSVAREHAKHWEQELEERVRQKTEELERAHRHLTHIEKMASLGKLSATVAHELNNPLAGILVYAKLIQRELAERKLSAESRRDTLRYVDVIRQESGRCGEIVKNLLTFARQSKSDFAQRELNPIIERSLMTVNHLIKNAAIELDIQLMTEMDTLTADANQIQQALVALLVNAVEAMPDGGELHVRASGTLDQIVLEIGDTGVGIAPEVLPHIFEPFVSTKADKGVGLGLAVVYGIVQRHEGTIDVSSAPGCGTTFRIALPRRLSAPDARSNPAQEQIAT